MRNKRNIGRNISAYISANIGAIKDEEEGDNMTNRMTELLAYLDRLIALRSVDYHCVDEIDDCIAMIVEELSDREDVIESDQLTNPPKYMAELGEIDSGECSEIDRQVNDSLARLKRKEGIAGKFR